MKIIACVILFSCHLSAAFAGDAASGTMEHPKSLDCRNLDAVIQARKGEGAVIAGSLTVEAENNASVPPAILGCQGKHHIVCVMETPLPVQRGVRLRIAGRLETIGTNYVMIDPCGVSPE